MARNATNELLKKAKKSKSDEFYTQLSDIESELQHYRCHFDNKSVYCNCDDPRISNFFKYFASNFKELGLRKLIAACFREQSRDLFNMRDDENGFFYEYTGTEGEKEKPSSIAVSVSSICVTVFSCSRVQGEQMCKSLLCPLYER